MSIPISKTIKYDTKVPYSILILCLFYLVGIIGILLPIHPDFILLTPFNLILSLVLVFWNHPVWDRFFPWFMVITYVWGFMAEVIGVQTGLIFGTYVYGPVLGWKLWDTPLLIGANWLMLTYCAGVVVNFMLKQTHWLLKGILGAGLMVGLDWLIEPVAIQYNFWQWEEVKVPLQNYLGWFLIALPLQWLMAFRYGQIRNKVALALFILQVLFFLILGIFGR
ncbi:MAG TPA: carotenoid biosynthesis protein [Saprospiraceae bacterium]|nr:carotenoid biosynthesis protein [Saprospiraceae bacterium]HMQ84818.1 carotenoid biosynthesis protein [Saprospiraceae bacterium]